MSSSSTNSLHISVFVQKIFVAQLLRKLIEASVQFVQLGVVSGFNDTTIIDKENLIGCPDCRQPVCDYKSSAIPYESGDSQLYQTLCAWVQIGGRLIQHQNSWICKERPSDCQPLPLSSRKT